MNEPTTFDVSKVVPLEGALSAALVWRLRVVPFARTGNTVKVLMDNSREVDDRDTAYHFLRCEDLDVQQVSTEELNAVMRRFYGSGEIDGSRQRRKVLRLRAEMRCPGDGGDGDY